MVRGRLLFVCVEGGGGHVRCKGDGKAARQTEESAWGKDDARRGKTEATWTVSQHSARFMAGYASYPGATGVGIKTNVNRGGWGRGADKAAGTLWVRRGSLVAHGRGGRPAAAVRGPGRKA
eukprot:scaffold7583_cov118-Isochrysis_galbana.AAC.9